MKFLGLTFIWALGFYSIAQNESSKEEAQLAVEKTLEQSFEEEKEEKNEETQLVVARALEQSFEEEKEEKNEETQLVVARALEQSFEEEKEEKNEETQLVVARALEQSFEEEKEEKNEETQLVVARALEQSFEEEKDEKEEEEEPETQDVSTPHFDTPVTKSYAPPQQPTPTESQQPDLAPVNTQNLEVHSMQPFVETTNTPVPEYNPNHSPQYDTAASQNHQYMSFFGEEKIVPEQHKFSKRLSISGHVAWGTSGPSNRFLNLFLNTSFGWIWDSIEIGPFIKINTPGETGEKLEKSYRNSNYISEIDFLIGLFGEFQFINYNKTQVKYVPAIGLRASYGRENERPLIQTQPYISIKYFLSDRTAVFASLAPYYTHKIDGGREWGLNIPIGLQIYYR